MLLKKYQLSIRSVLEFGAPIWTGGLTLANIASIEKVQKTCFKVILSFRYISYREAFNVLGETTLKKRRTAICKKFAKKCTKNPKMSWLFQKFTREMKSPKNVY